MIRHRWIVCALVSLLLVAPALPALAQQDTKDLRPEFEHGPRGHGYCFQRNLFFGSIVIPGGRCYNFYAVRNSSGLFLGFGPPDQLLIPQGQVARTTTSTGATVRGRLFFLVPLAANMIRIPMDSIQFVTVQVVTKGNRVVIRVPNVSDRLVEASFEQR